jgi:hypothetical protein
MSAGDDFIIFFVSSLTVSKSSSVGLPNLFMSKWVRDNENLPVDAFGSRQPELSLTTNLCNALSVAKSSSHSQNLAYHAV